MASEPDVIREQIEETRESLTDKIEALEGEFKGTIHEVTGAVEHTVDSVRSGVHEGVESVKRFFDLPLHVRERPWLMLGCAACAGATAGYLLTRPPAPVSGAILQPTGPGPYLAPAPSPQAAVAAAAAAPGPNGQRKPGMVDKVVQQFRPELEQVKEIAIGLAMGLARDLIKRALPPAVAANVDEIMASTTRKVGGEPIAGDILPPEREGKEAAPRA
jgi:ElaB/YqjD/DUF883 family membrane-anchored ribosome-binding protein